MHWKAAMGVSCVLATTLGAQVTISKIEGGSPGERFGWTVKFVGDVDDDGWSDLGIGSLSSQGKVHVYSGQTTLPIRTWSGLANPAYFGYSMAALGDMDGDGHDDVLVGASDYPMWYGVPSQGYAQLISGATGIVLHTFLPPAGALRFGHAVARGGDLDGDGLPEFLIGAPGGTGDTGYVYVYSSSTYEKIRRDGIPFATNFGAALTPVADFTGDGVDEYAAGAPAFEPYAIGGPTFPGPDGKYAVIDGASGVILSSYVYPFTLSDQFGWSLDNIGDVDADGVDDLVIGARDGGDFSTIACHSQGRVRVHSGATGAPIRSHPHLDHCGAYGSAVSSAGDLDGDGMQEYLGSEPGWELGYDPQFALRIFSGGTGQKIAVIQAPQPVFLGQAWGAALTHGDANGDGLNDLVVGAPYDDDGGNNAGAVYLYSIVRAPSTYCESEVNSLGCIPAIGSTGVCSATLATAFDVSAINVLNQKVGFCFYGLKPRQTPFQGGFMCIVAPTKRTPNQSSNGTAPPASDCSGTFTFDFNARIQSGVDPQLVAGEEVFVQYWSRDPADASTTNLSDALAFFITP